MNKSFPAGMLLSLAWLAMVASAFGQTQTFVGKHRQNIVDKITLLA